MEYSFPDTDAEKPNQKLLNMAARWAEQMSRKKKSEDSGASSSESSEDDDDDGLQGDEDDNRVLDDDQRTSRPGENFEELQLPDESDDDGE